MSKKQFCLLCNCDTFVEFPQSVQLKAVTSDCKPLDKGSLIIVCTHCGHIQKRLDSFWEEEVGKIYSEYDVYHLSGGREQVVFKNNSTLASPRSLRIIERLEQRVMLPKEGYLLDVGCGNGGLLKSFSKKYPGWTLAGYEQDARYKNEVAKIQGVRQFYSGDLNEVPGKFNLITLVHVLEHIPGPSTLLRQLRGKLAPDGFLLIHIPNCMKNPFDLVVMDHCSHFTTKRIIQLVQNSGFKVTDIATDWVHNYITLILAISAHEDEKEFIKGDLEEALINVTAQIEWLQQLITQAKEIANKSDFGIFGTAIAGTWLAGALGSAARFFVDEDSAKIGKTHIGLKVLSPDSAPKDSYVYLALPPETAVKIQKRLNNSRLPIKLVLPPSLSYEGEAMAGKLKEERQR